jgi:probable F420-dependent oxidoreductase
MRLLLGLPTDHVEARAEFGTVEAVVEMAQAAERLGYHGVFVTDHPAPPRSFIASGGHHALEPTVVLAAAAAGTTRLQLMTNLYIVAYRNPFLAAKSIATLDSLSGGRVVMGTGAGYLEGEFAAMGTAFDERNDVLDEHLRVMRSVWTGEPVTAAGPGYAADDIVALPTPLPRDGGQAPPIWVGGNSRRALRRVAELGDGWMPIATPGSMADFVRTASITSMEHLAARADVLSDLWGAAGRSGTPTIAMEPWDAGRYGTDRFDRTKYRDRLAELAAIGVTDAPVMLSAIGRGFELTRAAFIERAAEFIDAVG